MKRWIGVGMLVMLVGAPIVASVEEAWWLPFALLGGIAAGVAWIVLAMRLMESEERE